MPQDVRDIWQDLFHVQLTHNYCILPQWRCQQCKEDMKSLESYKYFPVCQQSKWLSPAGMINKWWIGGQKFGSPTNVYILLQVLCKSENWDWPYHCVINSCQWLCCLPPSVPTYVSNLFPNVIMRVWLTCRVGILHVHIYLHHKEYTILETW